MFKIIVLFVVFATFTFAEEEKKEEFKYVKPDIGIASHLAESFHDNSDFQKSWILSKAKKDGVEDTIAKYDGKWELEEPKDNALEGDLGLVLKSEAKHAAISSKLTSRFDFEAQPLIIQYEVKFQKAQECGGAYVKLLADKPDLNLDEFGDKTLYSIMFGPDKCGHDSKMHFIVQHENPLTGKVNEHHAKPPTGDFKHIFDDKKTHLVALIVRPGNTFDILVDEKVISSGSLLTDMNPPINPAKEIADPNDSKPSEWDEREKIPDPDATKPDDWDEDAPKKITDEKAAKPAEWLDDEPEHIPDPDAVKPADWDTAEDGEWEAPLIPNKKCAEHGCGEWKAPTIDNPAYKGKWVPALITNPAYKGIWEPKKIANPDYFEDPNPFVNLKPISAVGFELWSMQSDIVFDNLILSAEQSTVDQWTQQTWSLKSKKEGGSLKSTARGMFDSVLASTEERPWLWAVYGLVILLPFVLIYVCCFPAKDKTAARKKTDEPTPDDAPAGDDDAPAGDDADDNVSNRSVDSSAEEGESSQAEGSQAEEEVEKVKKVEEVKKEEVVVEEVKKEPEAEAVKSTDEVEAVAKDEPITNGIEEDEEASAEEDAPSPRATRSKRKSRKDT